MHLNTVGRKWKSRSGLQEPEQTCPRTQRQEAFRRGLEVQAVWLLPRAHSYCLEPEARIISSLLSFASSGIFFFWSGKKKSNKPSISYITLRVTCVKCTKSTFLLMEQPFANEVISDITAEKRGGFLSPFLPFCKPSEVANFVAFAVCAQYFNQLQKVMCFLSSYCIC